MTGDLLAGVTEVSAITGRRLALSQASPSATRHPMARSRQTASDDLFQIASKLPWKVSLALGWPQETDFYVR